MLNRNPRIKALPAQYLFPEVRRRKERYLELNPQAKLISLGIGDTTEPLPAYIAEAIALRAREMATKAGYTGYGPEEGELPLRQAIANSYYGHLKNGSTILPQDILISDGTKSDIGRLFQLFGPDTTIAVQDPTYPAYVEAACLAGIRSITLMPCTPENHFFPDLDKLKATDVIVWCSPNNPTGAAATYSQLEQLVAFAKKNGSLILYDAAYASYIDDPQLPRSIYEIPGSAEVAIEMGSFSKSAGFTGIRLGWTVVPQALRLKDDHPLQSDWVRMLRTLFNGASTLSQAGGLAALSPQGQLHLQETLSLYKGQAHALYNTFREQGFNVYGALHCPYVWLHVPNYSSWDLFTALLEKRELITTPGVGFGPSGESFVRFTAFTAKELFPEALNRLKNLQNLLDLSIPDTK